ncbi:hypothetical protein [Actinophytocola xinjiangensis]|nr:hypothetical protein [Actinophytocola xinjiangensis]
MVEGGELERLRTEAAGRDYPAMARLARALHENGLTTGQVLRECYGVPFPRELIVIADADPYTLRLLSMWTNQPWRLTTPPSRGGPAAEPDTNDPMERHFRAFDPDLLPLLFLIRPGIDVTDDELVVCYRLTELAAGRSTIYGAPMEPTDPDQVVRRADSLLAMLHQHHTAYLDELEEELAKSYRLEADYVDEDEIEEIRRRIRQLEDFQRA